MEQKLTSPRTENIFLPLLTYGGHGVKAEGTFNSACLMENRGFRRKKNKVVIADVFLIACVTRRMLL